MATFPLPLTELFGQWGSYAVYAMIGVAFGMTLEAAGFGNSKKLAAQFYFKDMRVFKVMFTELFFYEAQGQRSSIYRDIDFLEEKRERTCMVFMPVGNNNPLYLFPVSKQIRELRYDKINPEHIFLREHESRINNNNIIIIQ